MESTVMQPNSNSPALVKLIVGIFFTVVGLLLAADNLDLIVADVYLRYWPTVLIIIGALKAAMPGTRWFGIVLLGVGIWLLGNNLRWFRLHLSDLWPLILIGIGLLMVGRAVGLISSSRVGDFVRSDTAAIFSQRKVANTSQDFRGAGVTAIMGGYELDLTGADISNAPAVIEVFTMWGGIEITVPDNWEIIGEVTPFMGGFEIKTRSIADPKRRLIIRGVAWMAGVEVKSVQGRSV